VVSSISPYSVFSLLALNWSQFVSFGSALCDGTDVRGTESDGCLRSNGPRASRGGGDHQQHMNLILGEIPSVEGDLRFCLGVDRPYKTPLDDVESKIGGDGDRRRLNLGYITTTPRARKYRNEIQIDLVRLVMCTIGGTCCYVPGHCASHAYAC
jgi:hypothetical protein